MLLSDYLSFLLLWFDTSHPFMVLFVFIEDTFYFSLQLISNLEVSTFITIQNESIHFFHFPSVYLCIMAWLLFMYLFCSNRDCLGDVRQELCISNSPGFILVVCFNHNAVIIYLNLKRLSVKSPN
jgi:hypothetical protein